VHGYEADGINQFQHGRQKAGNGSG
jgi:hypothetical protein